MKIAIVEDHAMTRDLVKKVCLEESDIDVVVEAGTGSEAVDGIIRTNPDVVVLDLGLPDFDGFEVLERIRKMHVEPRVLAISSHASPYLVLRLEQARVHGFVDKCAQTADELRGALSAFRGKLTFFANTYLEIRGRARRDQYSFDKLLTNQQMLVLSMVANLCSDETIADSIHVAPRTVEAHRTAIMRKIGVHSRLELIRYAKRQGFM
jgi:DNA-binding NarL/FixJ family response regulator